MRVISTGSILLCHPLYPDDAFAQKNMPDLGHEIEDFQIFSWRLSKWKTLDKKLTSPEFECGGHRWYDVPQFSSTLRVANQSRVLQANLAVPNREFKRTSQ